MTTTHKHYIALSNHGRKLFLEDNPRKDLLDKCFRSHADRIYEDRGGKTYHIGYIVAGEWWTIFGLEGVTFAREV